MVPICHDVWNLWRLPCRAVAKEICQPGLAGVLLNMFFSTVMNAAESDLLWSLLCVHGLS